MKSILIVYFALLNVVLPSAIKHSEEMNAYEGSVAPRIFSGNSAERHQFPYQVAIHYYLVYICGGALLTPEKVVTAAHCKLWAPRSYHVILGMLYKYESHRHVQRIGIKRFITRPDYNRLTIFGPHDIALIVLAKSAVLKIPVQPIKLSTYKEQCKIINTTTLSVWGFTGDIYNPYRRLQFATLPRITNEKCSEDLISILGTSKPLYENMTCTTSQPDQFESACFMDGGSRLVLDSVLVGIASWTIPHCGILKRAPTVYTNVCRYIDFLKKYMDDV